MIEDLWDLGKRKREKKEDERMVEEKEEKMKGLVLKIKENMEKKKRERIELMRVW